MAQTCGDQLVVEHNGDVYTCDHFVYPEYLLGNIRDSSLRELYDSPRRREFGLAKRNALPDECLRCRFWHLCHGECPKHRFEEVREGRDASGKPGTASGSVDAGNSVADRGTEPEVVSRKNVLCAGFKRFFEHSEPYFLYMKERLEKQESPAWVMKRFFQ